MSVEDTLAERGKRYGDFTDHAEICQRLKLAMIAGRARWTRLSDVQKQALEVIADKIARILSGDPNYADNWHDIQGYAKLVEDRLPKTPMTFSERCAEIDAEVRAAVLGSKTNLTPHPDLVAAMRAQQPMLCPECGCPDNPEGIHYATCSKLTAPKEFVAEVEATFDELEYVDKGIATVGKVDYRTVEEKVAALSTADSEKSYTEPEHFVAECLFAHGAEILDDDGSVFGVTLGQVVAVMRVYKCPALQPKMPVVVVEEPRLPEPLRTEFVEALAGMENPEPTVDPTPTSCPGCGREEGLKHRRGCPTLATKHAESAPKDDPFAGAPAWAKYKAQDAGGKWWWYSDKPEHRRAQNFWLRGDASEDQSDFALQGDPNPNWRDTLIERT